MGYRTARDNEGDENVILGHLSAEFANDISGCVILGPYAAQNDNISNRFVVANSNTSTPLLDGRFDEDRLIINGALQLTNFTGTAVAGMMRWNGTKHQGYDGTTWNDFY